jgi:SPP1 gp7 family putative phage head morphogenesis protein
LKALATALAKGGTAGESATQIAERLRAVLTDDTWAHMAALTELTRASSAGAQTAYTDAGTALLAWNSEDDNRVCQVCLDNEGSDPQPIGGAWPDGSTAPPAHARCRCWLSPA